MNIGESNYIIHDYQPIIISFVLFVKNCEGSEIVVHLRVYK